MMGIFFANVHENVGGGGGSGDPNPPNTQPTTSNDMYILYILHESSGVSARYIM